MVKILIAIKEDHLDRIAELLSELTEKGFQPSQVLHNIGVIEGSAPENLISDLRLLPGVESVEEEGDVHI